MENFHKSDGAYFRNIDAVFVKNNEQAFVDMALLLGIDRLIMIAPDMKYRFPVFDKKNITILTACIVDNPNDISRARRNFNLIFSFPERKFFDSKPDYILGIELSDKKDSMHYRSTPLNQVHAALAAENKISLVFDFGILLHARTPEKPLYLGRMMQNARIARKYSVDSAIFSLAKAPFEMISPASLDALEQLLFYKN